MKSTRRKRDLPIYCSDGKIETKPDIGERHDLCGERCRSSLTLQRERAAWPVNSIRSLTCDVRHVGPREHVEGHRCHRCQVVCREPQDKVFLDAARHNNLVKCNRTRRSRIL
jgi:hypothetical protein